MPTVLKSDVITVNIEYIGLCTAEPTLSLVSKEIDSPCQSFQNGTKGS